MPLNSFIIWPINYVSQARHHLSLNTPQPNDLIRRDPLTLLVPCPPQTDLLEKPQLFRDDVEHGLSLPLAWHLPQVTSEHRDYNKVWSSLYTEGAETINALASLILLVFDLLPGRPTLHCRIILDRPTPRNARHRAGVTAKIGHDLLFIGREKKDMVSLWGISDVGCQYIHTFYMRCADPSSSRISVATPRSQIQEVLLLFSSSFTARQERVRAGEPLWETAT